MSAEVRPRVLHCITRLGLGGSERVALSIVKGFGATAASAIFTVHRGAADNVGRAMQAELEAARVPWFQGTRVTMKQGGMIPAAFHLARAVSAFRPDIVHFHSETPEAAGAAWRQLFDRGRATSAVRTIHNSVFWRFWPRIGRWCDHRLDDALIACVSHAAHAEFQRYRADSGARLPPADPTVIFNGVDLPRRIPAGAPLHPDRRRLLFAGRFDPQKGTDLLPEIMRRTQVPAGVRAELVLIGHGVHESSLRSLAARPPSGWDISVRPPVASLPAVLPDFDLFIMPSRFEGLGLTAIEASLTGVPVVATSAPGLADALPPTHPWWAKPGDAASFAGTLERALATPSTWSAAVEQAQRFALDRFAPEKMVAGYRRIYGAAVRPR